jgi:hypothetical protein
MGLELPVFRQPYAQEKLVRKLALKKNSRKEANEACSWENQRESTSNPPPANDVSLKGPISQVTDSDFFHSRESAPRKLLKWDPKQCMPQMDVTLPFNKQHKYL